MKAKGQSVRELLHAMTQHLVGLDEIAFDLDDLGVDSSELAETMIELRRIRQKLGQDTAHLTAPPNVRCPECGAMHHGYHSKLALCRACLEAGPNTNVANQ